MSLTMRDYDKIEEGRIEGRIEGRKEGQNDLVCVIKLLREGKIESEILEMGYAQDTIDLAKTVK